MLVNLWDLNKILEDLETLESTDVLCGGVQGGLLLFEVLSFVPRRARYGSVGIWDARCCSPRFRAGMIFQGFRAGMISQFFRAGMISQAIYVKEGSSVFCVGVNSSVLCK